MDGGEFVTKSNDPLVTENPFASVRTNAIEEFPELEGMQTV
jgi:hypothetical protein